MNAFSAFSNLDDCTNESGIKFKKLIPNLFITIKTINKVDWLVNDLYYRWIFMALLQVF